MDNDILKRVAKLGVLARKAGVCGIDFNRLLTERAYANELLSTLEANGDEDLLMLCLQLKRDLGVLPAVTAAQKPSGATADPARYLYSSRG